VSFSTKVFQENKVISDIINSSEGNPGWGGLDGVSSVRLSQSKYEYLNQNYALSEYEKWYFYKKQFFLRSVLLPPD